MIRTQVRAELARIIAESGITGEAVVSSVYPGDKHQSREMVFADSAQGVVTFPYGMAPPFIQRDNASVTWVVRIQAMPTLEDAMTRRDELAALIVGVLADDQLDGFEANGERVYSSNGVEGIGVESREGETATGAQIAYSTITVPYESQTKNEEG